MAFNMRMNKLTSLRIGVSKSPIFHGPNRTQALIFNLKNPSSTVLYAKNRLQVAAWWRNTTRPWTCTVFFQKCIRTKSLVVKVSSSEFGDLGSVPDEC